MPLLYAHTAIKPHPSWLSDLNPDTVQSQPLPLLNLLEESLYYPASAQDGLPIRALNGEVHSFIYVDYGYNEAEVKELVHRALPATNTKPEGRGLRGYRLLGFREIDKHEVTPAGWVPPCLEPADGNPSRHLSWMKSPFALWAVFERNPDLDEQHGPERLSLLYICGDGAATYDALYRANGVTAKYVAIIAPGTGFGFNWTDYRKRGRIFWRVVMNNPAGQPEFLISEHSDHDEKSTACWPEFSEAVGCLDRLKQVGIWRRPLSL